MAGRIVERERSLGCQGTPGGGKPAAASVPSRGTRCGAVARRDTERCARNGRAVTLRPKPRPKPRRCSDGFVPLATSLFDALSGRGRRLARHRATPGSAKGNSPRNPASRRSNVRGAIPSRPPCSSDRRRKMARRRWRTGSRWHNAACDALVHRPAVDAGLARDGRDAGPPPFRIVDRDDPSRANHLPAAPVPGQPLTCFRRRRSAMGMPPDRRIGAQTGDLSNATSGKISPDTRTWPAARPPPPPAFRPRDRPASRVRGKESAGITRRRAPDITPRCLR